MPVLDNDENPATKKLRKIEISVYINLVGTFALLGIALSKVI